MIVLQDFLVSNVIDLVHRTLLERNVYLNVIVRMAVSAMLSMGNVHVFQDLLEPIAGKHFAFDCSLFCYFNFFIDLVKNVQEDFLV